MKLVIVESPTKAKTIKKFLPEGFVVESSFGHIRDLPQSADDIPAQYKKNKWARLGINIEADFEPLYIVPADKKKQVTKLKQLVKEADELYLATDEDREGEAISWHLLEVLKPSIPIKRMVFHEITKEAIIEALQNPRTVDDHLVSAQETRRLLDRLYGYEISPVLWRKVAPKLSAGRVQSSALHLIVQREKDRTAFKTAAYWDIVGEFATTAKAVFPAKLIMVGGKRLAIGKDFAAATGQLTPVAAQDCVVLNQPEADALMRRLNNSIFTVNEVQQKPLTLSPKPPFITSTLQQDAGRKLGWSASKTMRTAQRLYEQGYITYMRTDSVQLSEEALMAARGKITALYGENYLPTNPRNYKTKNKTAQEAHEAIRPAGKLMRSVGELTDELGVDEAKLYDLIWKRTVASQMVDAKLKQTTARLLCEDVIFQANGRVVTFPGYLQAYVDSEDEINDDNDVTLPSLATNDQVRVKSLMPTEHHTKPPARYTEASLIKELESVGIGRPSTYATIIDTIQNRGYVYKDGSALVPRFVAFAVDGLLAQNFSNVVNTEYTAKMEEELDRIAAGEIEAVPYLKTFYFGDDKEAGLHNMLKAEIDPRQVCTIPVGRAPDGSIINVRVGRYGPFIERITAGSTEPEQTASIPADLAPDALTIDKALEYIAKQAEGPKALGVDPVTGEKVYLLEGRFGPYVQLGEKPKIEAGTKKVKGKTKVKKPKMKGLLKGMTVADMTLETALQLLNLPRTLGTYPKTGESIVADAGRFGPYIRCGIETRSLKTDDNLLTLSLERAIELLDTPKLRGGRGSAIIKTLGEHPTIKKPIELRIGKFGPYLKCGQINAALPKDTTADALTIEQAVSTIDKKAKR